MTDKVRIYSDATGLWWRPDGKGYTYIRAEAGLYTRADAKTRITDDPRREERLIDEDDPFDPRAESRKETELLALRAQLAEAAPILAEHAAAVSLLAASPVGDLGFVEGIEALLAQLAAPLRLPSVEEVSARVHEAWMESKRRAGVTSRKLEGGEELMVPYADLSEQAKELDRGTVRAVYEAIAKSR